MLTFGVILWQQTKGYVESITRDTQAIKRILPMAQKNNQTIEMHLTKLSHVTSGISRPNYFFTSICPLSITFTTKFYLCSEAYISYTFYAGYHQKRDFLERFFV